MLAPRREGARADLDENILREHGFY